MKKYVIILLVFAIIGTITGWYLYTKPVKSTSSKSTDISLNSEELFNAFTNDEAAANSMYLDKVVSVTGDVTNVSMEDGHRVIRLNSGTEMFGVVCKMEQDDSDAEQVNVGEKITIKGICTGMLMDVIMVRCVMQ